MPRAIHAEVLTNPVTLDLYRTLPDRMFADARPTAVTAPTLTALNLPLLDEYGLDHAWFESTEALSLFAGNVVNDDNPPIALAYSGHQFGSWVPLLGDGRAHMLGQMQVNESSVDVQLKGSGRTAFSRGGDGRATLASVLREYLVSEAMAGLGIPTTRSLAIISSGETVRRERRFPGAILVRTAQSHIRVGSFQYASANLGNEAVKALADHVIARHYPALAEKSEPYADFLGTVVNSQARLVAQWMLVGFIHGVMNTDNMSIVGETIDFGPCAFMDEFHPQKVFSSIDHHGRYAWDKQPAIGVWNLSRLAETLLPLLNEQEKKAISMGEEQLSLFGPTFDETFYGGLRAKLALPGNSSESDKFADATLAALAKDAIDYTVFFDTVTRVAMGESDTELERLFGDIENAQHWIAQWREIAMQDDATLAAMRGSNPVVIARNHRVEQALNAAVDNDDFKPFEALSRVLAKPFDVAAADRDYETPPLAAERVTETFCGT